MRCVAHFGQLMDTGTFNEFDFGTATNRIIYGQDKAPEIDVGRGLLAKIPIALYVGKHDTLVNTENSRWLHKMLYPNIVDYWEVDGGHIQFFLADDVTYWTERAMKLIKRFNPIQL